MLEIVDVSKNFGGLIALNHVNVQLPPNRIYGLIGPNGAGKTTLFNLITGLLPVSGGTIHFQGQTLISLPPHQISRLGIARTFQNIRLFPTMTVLENVLVAQNIHTRSGITSLFQFKAQADKKLREEAETLLQENKKVVLSVRLKGEKPGANGNSRLFKGQMELRTSSAEDFTPISRLKDSLVQIPNIKYTGEVYSEDGTCISFDVKEHLPVLAILSNMPSVEELDVKPEGIRLVMKN